MEEQISIGTWGRENKILTPEQIKAMQLDKTQIEWRKIDVEESDKSPFCHKCMQKDYKRGQLKERDYYCKMEFLSDNIVEAKVSEYKTEVTGYNRDWKCPYDMAGKTIFIPIKKYKIIEK